MERDRRDTNSQEDSLWGNPCDVDLNSVVVETYSPKKAKEIADQASNAFQSSGKFQDMLAKQLHSYSTFAKLLADQGKEEWLRNFNWFREEVLPKEKILNEPMPDEYMIALMAKIDEVLPSMYMGLKMVVAGLYTVSKDGFNEAVVTGDALLKQNFTQTMHNVRAVLCLFSELMRSRKLQIMPLPNSEIPPNTDKLIFPVLVYRDTLNYLEYLSQVFRKMSEVNPPMTAN